MTPKQKASELFNRFMPLVSTENDNNFGNSNMNQRINAKESCDIVIDQVFTVLESGNLYMEFTPADAIGNTEYWVEVKKELETIFQDTRVNP